MQSQLLAKIFENIMGKGENAGYQHFFSFPHNVFNPFQYKFLFFSNKYFVIC